MAKKSLGRDFVQTPVNPHLFRLRLYFFQIRITALMMNIMLIVDPQDRQWWKINISAMAKFFLLLVFPELVFSPVFSRPFFKWFFTGLLGGHEKHKIWDFSIRWWWGVSPAIKFFFNYCFFVIPSTITIINNNVLEKVLLEGWGVRDLLSKTLIFLLFWMPPVTITDHFIFYVRTVCNGLLYVDFSRHLYVQLGWEFSQSLILNLPLPNKPSVPIASSSAE